MHAHLQRMGRYNRWANQRLYDACAALPAGEFEKDRPAFFRSISGTLNHLLVTDRIWLDRILGRPFGGGKVDDRPFPRLDDLLPEREKLDREIIDAVAAMDDSTLAGITTYRMMTSPTPRQVPTALCWLHMFNHQTHHRGQVHDQMSQTATPPPSMDLIYFVYEEMA
ncbi:DinB family protein [Geminicoccus roseus]|uniref:DinB family protein n=1 Tax=Geminicoccus roseus TaxID=404900 RepID=UPI0003F4CD8E|nr:DinB family protein [Geminicoccus roseus]